MELTGGPRLSAKQGGGGRFHGSFGAGPSREAELGLHAGMGRSGRSRTARGRKAERDGPAEGMGQLALELGQQAK